MHDTDGSFLGKGEAYIIPQTDISWDVSGEESRGIGDHLIPSAMMVDTEGNRLDISVVRPFTGV